ncbi:MAG: UDP-N-acetylmuramate--L-alanine ligase [Epulopiscium sp. Nele67-Bin001]|nr:MAG: UDP-N-acetylmuramate--L-alanine ligase [Epulopiscium sp. Nele67-Bin001]
MTNVKRIHFIGIGGISMSGLAEIMHHRGFEVSGSDMRASEETRHLESLGVTIMPTHSRSNITPDIDLVVYTAAIADDNPELIQAKDTINKVETRAQFLGSIMKMYDCPICVAGTHGKTTTTSMLANVLLGADKNPTITVGGIVEAISGNIHIGGHEIFLTEACEYHNSFLDFNPKIGIILNVEADHMDFFKDLDDIRNSFTKFSNLLPSDGFLVINKISAPNTADVKCCIETFGLDDSANWYATNVSFNDKACATFTVNYNGTALGELTIGVTGSHNVLNALSVCAVANFLKVPFSVLQEYLVDFSGAKRRFEYKGCIHNVTIIDDYAHHPTEIKATLETAKKYPHKNLYVVFQPHTYTRTKAFLNEFAQALGTYGHIILTDIYAAREKNPGDIHSKDIEKLLAEGGTDVTYIDSFDEIADYLLLTCNPDDLIITMGAGNINQVADILLGK